LKTTTTTITIKEEEHKNGTALNLSSKRTGEFEAEFRGAFRTIDNCAFPVLL